MPRKRPSSQHLREQIEATSARRYPTDSFESRIAAALLENGRFRESIGPDELAAILRHIVHAMFGQQRFAGRKLGLVHNVARMDVSINACRADVSFLVHIHRPVVAFLKFNYTLENDPRSQDGRLRLRPGSLVVSEHTRRFDLKAKAALATINVRSITLQELGNPANIILRTLPPQLQRLGIVGALTSIELMLEDHALLVSIEGDFSKVGSIETP